MSNFENARTLVRPLPEDAAELNGLEETLRMLPETSGDNAATLRRPADGGAGTVTLVRNDDVAANAATVIRFSENPAAAATVIRPPAVDANAATVARDTTEDNKATVVRSRGVDVNAATVASASDSRASAATVTFSGNAGDAGTVDVGAATVAPADSQSEAFRETVLRSGNVTAGGSSDGGAGQSAAGRGGSLSRSQSVSLRTGASAISINVHSRNISLAPGISGKNSRADINSDYELQDKLGEGGMGVVYTARQSSIDRQIALKMMKVSANDAARAKFLQEAVVTGDLDHPNIVTIHDLGTDAAGNIFYAMKKISGMGWNKAIAGKSRQENLDILLRVCDGVAFAHARGIIHRDLKPENVMLGAFGEVIVMDWGLAIAVNDNGKAERASAELGIAGTPAYLAPEMAVPGRWREIGTASDIYLLGAILFEILTGERPHDGKNINDCLRNAARNVIRETPQKGELMDIALRAMATRPAERYPRVQDFQAAIRDYQAHAEAALIIEKAQEQFARAGESGKYDDFASAVYRFRQARELWDGNGTALEGLKTAIGGYAGLALQRGDLDLARSLVEQDNFTENAALHARILDALRERGAARRRARFFRRAAIALTAAVVLISVGAAVWINAVRRDEARALKAKLEAQQQELRERQAKVAAQKEARESKEDIRRREELAANRWWAFPAEEARARQAEAARRENLPVALSLGNSAAPLKMRLIPAGLFAMGSPLAETGRLSEENLHRVRITRPFYLAEVELTSGQMRALGLKVPAVPQNLGLTSEERQSPAMPVSGFSWDEVREKIIPAATKSAPPPVGWHYALPTEAQWEWACRAGANTAFANGGDAAALKKIGVSGAENRLYPAPAGRKVPNAWGLYDMHGNLAEWCADAYQKDAYFVGQRTLDDPRISDGKTGKRVLRGGSWANMEEHCRSAYRSYATAAGKYLFVGVRLALVRDAGRK